METKSNFEKLLDNLTNEEIESFKNILKEMQKLIGEAHSILDYIQKINEEMFLKK